MFYQYVAYNENGELVKGKLSAITEDAAAEMLSYAGYKAVSLKPYVPFLSLDKLSASLFTVKPSEIILLYRQLAMLLESGTDIATSLELLQEQADNRGLKKILGEVITDVRSGSQLSTAMGNHPKAFPQMYSRLLSMGEQSGNLEHVLRQVAEYMEKEDKTSKETKNAMTYPTITLLITVIVVGVLVTFVLPSFNTLYASLGVEMPPLAQALVSLSNWLRDNILYLLLVILAIGGGWFFYIRTSRGRYNWDRLMLKLPRVGRVKHLSELARCCRSLSLLFQAGIPINEVMTLITQGCGNKAIAEGLSGVQKDMVKGEGLSRPMAKNKLFLPMMVQMVRVGEETGNLDNTLLTVAQSYEIEAENRLRSLINLIQPTMTLFIGLIIGIIALSLTSALYSMYGQGF